MKSRAFGVAALLLVAGCGGGGSGSTGGSQTPVVLSPSPSPGPTPQNTARLVLTFPVGVSTHSDRKNPQYVSPNSTQVDVKVNSVNGGVLPSWVPADTIIQLVFSGGGQNCTVSASTATCTLTVPAPPGSVSYTISILDASNNVLATNTATVTIVQGTTNTVTVTLLGSVATVSLTGPTLNANTPSSGAALTMSAFDKSGAQIVGSDLFANPITLTDNDATGSTALILNGGAPSSSVIVTKPTDVVQITYSGLAANNFTISASGTGITGGGTISTTVNDVTFTGTTLDDAAHGGLNTDPNWGQQTLFFASAGGSQNVTGAELGYTNAPFNKQFTISLDAATCGRGAGAVATVSPNPGPQTTFTVMAQNVGICKAKLSETGAGYPITQHTANSPGNATHDGTFWISVTSGSFSIN